MQLLSIANYLFRPHENAVTALLLIAKILQNDLEPEAARTILSMVETIADRVGLTSTYHDDTVDIRMREVINERRLRLW